MANKRSALNPHYVNQQELKDEVWLVKCMNSWMKDENAGTWDHAFNTEERENKIDKVKEHVYIVDDIEVSREHVMSLMVNEGERYRIPDVEYVPLKQTGKYKNRLPQATPFPTFRIYEVVNGKPIEIYRACWLGSIGNGHIRGMDEIEVTQVLWDMVHRMAQGIGSKKNWRGYPDIEDWIMEATCRAVKSVLKYDECFINQHGKQSSAYSYLYSSIERSFLAYRAEYEKRKTKFVSIGSSGTDINDFHENMNFTNYYEEVENEENARIEAMERNPAPVRIIKRSEMTAEQKAMFPERKLTQKQIEAFKDQAEKKERAIDNRSKGKSKTKKKEEPVKDAPSEKFLQQQRELDEYIKSLNDSFDPNAM